MYRFSLIILSSVLRHLQNFVLLFASNVENLLAFMFRYIMNESLLHYTECLLGMLYLHLVVKNLLWFISPLKDRDEYTNLEMWFEDKVDYVKERLKPIETKIRKWVPGLKKKERRVTQSEPGRKTFTVTKAAMLFKRRQSKMAEKDKTESGGKNGRPVSFEDFAKND